MNQTKLDLEKLVISDYDYFLPEARIAKYPVAQRDQSKLLFYDHEQITECLFSDIPFLIEPNSLIVVNNTKVVHARLLFKRRTGSTIEIFLIEPHTPSDYNLSFTNNQRVAWKCIVGNLKKWKEQELFMKIGETDQYLRAYITEKQLDNVIIEFTWDNINLSFAKVLEICGLVPIPPYLNRNSEESDDRDYQTIYAKSEGSVAAPTAGLHFTDRVIKNLIDKGITIKQVTLHVGAGTFKPVKTDKIIEHDMHTEHFMFDQDLVEKLINNHGSTISVGTTSLRALESIYWLGVKRLINPNIDTFHIDQWEVYELPQDIDYKISYKALLEVFNKNEVDIIEATTRIMIVPGYKFRSVSHLITNFHQPRSTLLLLIATFVGEEWKKIYEYALEKKFRFLSYGDSSLLVLKESL